MFQGTSNPKDVSRFTGYIKATERLETRKAPGLGNLRLTGQFYKDGNRPKTQTIEFDQVCWPSDITSLQAYKIYFSAQRIFSSHWVMIKKF